MNNMNPKVAWTILIVFLVIVLGAVGYFGYKYYQDLSKSSLTVTPATTTNTTDATADWETYTNTVYGFSFKYPSDTVILEGDATSKTKSPTIQVTTEKIASIGSQTNGFDQETAVKDKAAIEKGDYSTAMGWGVAGSYKKLNITGATGKQFVTLSAFEVCDVQLTRTAVIYTTDSRIILTFKYNDMDKLKANNPSYFKSDKTNCGDVLIWKDSAQFYADLVAGKTDSLSQAWYGNFDKTISTLKITAPTTTTTDETANWKTYTNDVWKFSFKYPNEYSISNDLLPKEIIAMTTAGQGLKLKNSSDANSPILSLYVNPAGWGAENYDKTISTENYTIGGVEKRLNYAEDTTNKTRLAMFETFNLNNIDYSISFNHSGTDNYLSDFKQILSTFQFTQ